MNNSKVLQFLKNTLENMPSDWLNLTTHRLDIYNEQLAKTQFLDEFEKLFASGNAETAALSALPTAYDYIRLGHPLSSVLEWALAHFTKLKSEQVISFSSQTMPALAILRHNLFAKKATQIVYTTTLPEIFKTEVLGTIYGYSFELKQVASADEIPEFEGSTVLISDKAEFSPQNLNPQVDFYLNLYGTLGSVLVINGQHNLKAIAEIQHVRRRESIAMTPADCYTALQQLTGHSVAAQETNTAKAKTAVIKAVADITGAPSTALFGSCGLSVQYAIMMGLIDAAVEKHPAKAIKFIVPPNCYGGTNDQARRVAACLDNVEVVDLPVDGDNDMVKSIDSVLSQMAEIDAVPYIIAEIPTNPRVEVPNLEDLKAALSKERKTPTGANAIEPVFILDQTFCPNVHFLGEGEILSGVPTISYASGSKFPSGGQCTAGYCVANAKAAHLMTQIELHLNLCDNEATSLQYEILARQLPSMNERIAEAYTNTRKMVEFIKATLPAAKINFVSEELAQQGFTPSVFSLDLPTKGGTEEEREAYKRALNHKLIDLMITEIPTESKYCVSYGQLKGCYWTIPATSTQGTTKEGDKDYIARVAVSPDLNLERHKEVFLDFVKEI
jgi:cystathionine beta-lyase/cystathionine gamma-synthase